MRGRPREFDREEVLDRAMEVFWAQGYEATPVSELVDQLGIGRQSLYLAFGGKRELFEEALRRYSDLEVAPMLQLLRAEGPPLENVRNVLRLCQSRGCADDFKGCMIGHAAAEFGIRDQRLAAVLDQTFRRLEDAFADALRRAQGTGELSADKEPRTLARLLISAIQGMALWGPVRQSPAYVRDVIRSLHRLLD